jgi:hypothetical protein
MAEASTQPSAGSALPLNHAFVCRTCGDVIATDQSQV